MKKFFMLAAMSAALCLGAVACGDDDDDDDNGNGDNVDNVDNGGNTSGNVVASADLSDFGGVRLDNVDDIFFDYDSDGVLTRVNLPPYNSYLFDYKNATLTSPGDSDQDCRFTTDKMGRITSITYSNKYDDVSENTQLTFRYNKGGHLIFAEENFTYSKPNEAGGEKKTVNCIWDGDLLTKCENELLIIQNGVTVKSYRSTYNYGYTDAPDNHFMQYTVWGSRFMEVGFAKLIYAGLYGKGPSKYPTTYSWSSSEYGESNLTIRYELNDKGLVKTEEASTDYADAHRYTYK